MVIYGVTLLAGCMLAGIFVGELLGKLIGVQANVGGVGISMLLMIVLADYLRKRGRLNPVSQRGILFWSSIYIPVVVAMAARQNVIAAVKGGPVALLAGSSAVVVSCAPFSLRGAKHILTRMAEDPNPSLEELSTFRALREQASRSDDHEEAKLAFKERRRPLFKGKCIDEDPPHHLTG